MGASSTAARHEGGSELHAPVGTPLRVIERRDAARDGATERAIDACWARLRAGNPRLFDGEIWSVRGFDAERGVIDASRDRYAALACAREVGTGACLLGVTGIVRRVRAGAREVLVARRGAGVLAYPGLWELAPAGGIACAPGETPTDEAMRDQIRREGAEELEMPSGAAPIEVGRVAALVHDRHASSLDVVFWCEASAALVRRLESPLHGWECDEAAWLTRAEAEDWAGREPEAFIPPTRLLLREIAWVEESAAW
ncbi:MAG: hypothetical protein IT439_04430 [Phycisphaerales bacterium]|nr:hypothetical protein [Phycisphaerales bacterium]